MNNQSCPNCNSAKIEGQSFTVEENKAIQEMFCAECYYEYTDIYSLTEQRENPE